MFKIFSALLLVCLSMSLSVQALAVDLFTISQPASSRLIQDSSLQSKGQQFKATLNSAALEASEVIVNLPNKRLRAEKLTTAGTPQEKIEPYSLLDQSGAVFLHSNNGVLEEIIIYDEEAKTVLKGFPQANGEIEFSEVNINTYICDDYQTDTQQPNISIADANYYENLTDLTLEKVSTLQSRPGASNVLFIDYFSGSMSGTAWNTIAEQDPIIYDNFSADADASTFSLIDLQHMYAAWAETADDYSQFDVNVITDPAVYAAVSNRNKSKIIATSTNWRGTGGVAFVGTFGATDIDFYNIGWAFNRNFSSLGITLSHESGHQMGLSHDGNDATPYYNGHGNYGPIMGTPFGKDFVQWDKGQYPNANQTEDDIAIITGKLGALPDDHGGDNASATSLPAGEINLVGVIAPQASGVDTDTFKFTLTSSQNPQITVRNLYNQPTPGGTSGGLNLSAAITLRDSSNNIVSQKLPSINSEANDFVFSQTLNAGTYYLSIQNQSYDSNLATGFSEYANGGYYQILMSSVDAGQPDLAITAESLTETQLTTNQNVTISTTVSNLGAGSSDQTILTYYGVSLQTETDSQDAAGVLATVSIPSLAANDSFSETTSIPAPSIPGTYQIRSCVDEVSNESNTDNNCSDFTTLTFTAQAPDLLITIDSISEINLTTNQSFTVSTTASNAGNVDADATTISYYVNRPLANSLIADNELLLGTSQVDSINAGDSSSQTATLNAPTAVGTYYLIACINEVESETATSNNCSQSSKIRVNVAAPDLVITLDSLSETQLAAGEAFTASTTALNQGFITSDATTISYYATPPLANNSIADNRLLLGTSQLSSINAGDSSSQTATLNAPAAAGTYFLLACINEVESETDTSNNCSQSSTISVNVTAPDLVITLDSLSETQIVAGETFTASTTALNQGFMTSEATTINYYATLPSANNSIADSRLLLRTSPLEALDSNASSSQTVSLEAPSSKGYYFISACIEEVTDELDTNNNCSDNAVITVVIEDEYEADNTSRTANAIANNETQLHTIHIPTDEDWLTFTLDTKAQNVVIQTSVANHANINTTLTLYDEALAQIAFNEETDNETLSSIQLDSLNAGNYFVQVTGSSGVISPSYNVTLSYDEVETEEFGYFNYLMTIITPTLSSVPEGQTEAAE